MPVLIPEIALLDYSLLYLQTHATERDLKVWAGDDSEKTINLLFLEEGKTCMPAASAPLFIAQYHGVGHRGWQNSCEILLKDFFIANLPKLVKTCVTVHHMYQE